MKKIVPGGLEAYRSAVYGICWCVLRHAQDAEDAAQEALLEAAKQGAAVRDAGRLDAWLHRVALHTALDALRRRRTRSRHEDLAARTSERAIDPRIEALYVALAEMAVEDRRLLIEHFLQKKTLREMADGEKCSEVGVWKRIGRAKERLRTMLTATGAGAAVAIMASEGFGRPSLPPAAGKVAILAAAVVVVLGAATVRSGAPPADGGGAVSLREASAPAAAPAVVPAPESSVLTAETPAPRSVARPPYPYVFPPPHWPPAAAATWKALRTVRLKQLDLQEVPLSTLLDEVSRQTGVRITLVPGLWHQPITFKVDDIILDSTLRLALQPRQLSFELLEDGSLRVDPENLVTGRLEAEARGIESVLGALDTMRRRLSEGWDGRDCQPPDAPLIEKIRTTKVLASADARTAEGELVLLREAAGINLMLDAADWERVRPRFSQPRVSPIVHGTVEQHLDRFCAEFGLGYAVSDNVVILSTPEKAEGSRRKLADDVAARKTIRARLDQRTPPGLPSTMPDLVAALERAFQLEIRVSQKVWESRTEFAIPAGIPLREALDSLGVSDGFRWALDYQLYIVD